MMMPPPMPKPMPKPMPTPTTRHAGMRKTRMERAEALRAAGAPAPIWQPAMLRAERGPSADDKTAGGKGGAGGEAGEGASQRDVAALAAVASRVQAERGAALLQAAGEQGHPFKRALCRVLAREYACLGRFYDPPDGCGAS